MLTLHVQNISTRKHLYRRRQLEEIALAVLDREKVGKPVEISLLFCDDAFICALNHQYRKINRPTDVLAFAQEGLSVGERLILGDIVISLETVDKRNNGNPEMMREEVQLLFCHGLLHLLGYDHRSSAEKKAMFAVQDEILEAAKSRYSKRKSVRLRPGSKRENVRFGK